MTSPIEIVTSRGREREREGGREGIGEGGRYRKREHCGRELEAEGIEGRDTERGR